MIDAGEVEATLSSPSYPSDSSSSPPLPTPTESTSSFFPPQLTIESTNTSSLPPKPSFVSDFEMGGFSSFQTTSSPSTLPTSKSVDSTLSPTTTPSPFFLADLPVNPAPSQPTSPPLFEASPQSSVSLTPTPISSPLSASKLLSPSHSFEAFPSSVPVSQDGGGEDQDDFEFSTFTSSAAPTSGEGAFSPLPLASPIEPTPSPLEVVVGAPSSLSISGVFEQFAASTSTFGSGSEQPKLPTLPPNSIMTSYPPPSSELKPVVKKVDWSAVDPSDIFGLEVSSPPSHSSPFLTSSSHSALEQQSTGGEDDWSGFTAISSTPKPFPAPAPIALSSLIAPIPVSSSVSSSSALLNDNFLNIGGASVSKPKSDSQQAGEDELFALFGGAPKASTDTTALPPAYFHAPPLSSTPTPANGPSNRNVASPQQPSSSMANLIQVQESLIQQERLTEAGECRSFIQSKRVPPEDLLTKWRGPSPPVNISISAMLERLSAKDLAKAQTFSARFKEPSLPAVAKKDLAEGIKRQSEALQFFKQLLSNNNNNNNPTTGTRQTTVVRQDQMNTWQTTLEFCLAEIEIADQFVRSTLNKAKSVPSPSTTTTTNRALLEKVFLSQKAQEYFLGLSEVYNIACRLRMSLQFNRETLPPFTISTSETNPVSSTQLLSLIDQITNVWTNIFAQLRSVSMKVPGERRGASTINELAENSNNGGGTCTLCLLPTRTNDSVNPSLFWDGKGFHTSCANFLSNRS
jgi:hypothetical protein